MNQRIIVITGPTASGKSGVALDMAKMRGGVIINADSMQLYREAPILTAQPSDEERQQIPHRLYAIRNAIQACSVAEWLEMVNQEIRQVWGEKRLPIITGGTGMYIRALLYGIAPVPDINPAIREEVRQMSADALYRTLVNEDERMAQALRPSDTQRLARALEVIRSTGKSLAWWQGNIPVPPFPIEIFDVHLLSIDRAVLYERINQRFEHMMQQGALEEARTLHTMQLARSLPLLRAVGIVELLQHLDGLISLEEAVTLAKTHSRHYAKRQLTWLRHQFHGVPFQIISK